MNLLKHAKKLRIWNLAIASILCVLWLKMVYANAQKEKTDNHWAHYFPKMCTMAKEMRLKEVIFSPLISGLQAK